MRETERVVIEVPRWQTLPWEFWFWLIVFVACVVCASFTARVAHAKGYSAGNWFAGGFFFGVIALLAAIGLPDRARAKASPFMEAIVCDACGFFGRPGKGKAFLACPFCGSDRLIPADSPRGRKLIAEFHSEKAQ